MKIANVVVATAVVVVMAKLEAYHNPFGPTAKVMRKLSFKKKKK